MNNDELKKKIISALQSVEFVTEKGWCGQCISLRLDYSAIADALIAAGIGDLKEHRIFSGKDGSIKQLYSGEEVEQIVKERKELKDELRSKVEYIHEQDEVIKEYKHRAERAERQARKACEVVFSEEIDNEPWDDMLYIYKDECGIDELGITSDMLYNYLKEQAEKELAEEGKE